MLPERLFLFRAAIDLFSHENIYHKSSFFYKQNITDYIIITCIFYFRYAVVFLVPVLFQIYHGIWYLYYYRYTMVFGTCTILDLPWYLLPALFQIYRGIWYLYTQLMVQFLMLINRYKLCCTTGCSMSCTTCHTALNTVLQIELHIVLFSTQSIIHIQHNILLLY